MRSCLCLLALVLFLAGCSEKEPAIGGSPPRPAALEVAGGAPAGLVDFGNVTVGHERVRRVRLRNAGDLPLKVEAPAVGAPFTSDAEATELAGGEELEVAFGVALQAEGLVTSTARIPSSVGAIDLLLRAGGVGCVVAVADVLDFGTALAGGRVERSAEVSNVGAGTCTIDRVQVDGDAFTVAPQPKLTLLPGSKTRVPVAFVPQAAGDATGTLRIGLEGGAVHTVSLRGDAVAGCLEVAPASIDFGTLAVCTASVTSREVIVSNTCEIDLTWNDVWIEQPDPPVFFAQFFGSSIPAGSSTAIEVGVLSTVGGVHTGTLHLELVEGGGAELPLRVEIDAELEGMPVTDTFPIQRSKPVDVLVVVDDTTAMADHADGFEMFADALARRLDGYDFHLGVTTVSSATAEGCAAAPDGRLVPVDGSAPRILGRETPDLVATLHGRLLSVGTCQDPSTASGLASAWRALDGIANLQDDPAYPEPDDGNAGFLRPGSHLVVIFLVASDDHSADGAPQWATRFASLAGFDDVMGMHTLDVQTWLEMPSGLCDGGTSNDYELFTGLLGGVVRNLCFSPWSAPSVLPIPAVPSTYYLTGWPRDRDGDGLITEAAGEMSLALDGEPVPEFTDDGRMVWSFYPSTNSIRFADGHRPDGGGTLTATYSVACSF